MTTTVVAGRVSTAADELAGLESARLGDDELLSLVREVERARRRLEAVETRLIAEMAQRDRGYTSGGQTCRASP